MGQLVQELSFKDNGYSSGIESAKSKLQQMNEAVGVSDNGLMQLNRTYRAGKRELQNLTNQYRSLSDEMRNSDFGHQLEQQIRDAQGRLAEFNDTIGDTSYMISAMASDTYNIDVCANSFSLAAGAIQGAAGVVGLFTDNQETLNNVLSTATAIQGGYQVAIALVNAAQDTNLAGLIKNRLAQVADTVATNLDIAAKNGNAIATRGLTMAQAALNAVLSMSPWGIIIAAIGIAATAFVGITALVNYFKDSSDEANDSTNNLTNSISVQSQVLNDLNNASNNVNSTIQQQIAVLNAARNIIASTAFSLKEKKEALAAAKKVGLEYNGVMDGTASSISKACNAIDKMIPKLYKLAEAQAAAELFKKYSEQRLQAKLALERENKYRGGVINSQTRRHNWNPDSNAAQNKFQNDSLNRSIGLEKKIVSLDQNMNQLVRYTKSNGTTSTFVKNVVGSDTKGSTTSNGGKSSSSKGGKSTTSAKTKKTENTTEKQYNDKLADYTSSITENNKLERQGLITHEEYLQQVNSAAMSLIRYINGIDNLTDEQKEVLQVTIDQFKSNKNVIDLIDKNKEIINKETEARQNIAEALNKAVDDSKDITSNKSSSTDKKVSSYDTNSMLSEAQGRYSDIQSKIEALHKAMSDASSKGIDTSESLSQLIKLEDELRKTGTLIDDISKKSSEDDIANSIGADKVLAPAKEIGEIFKSNADSTEKFAGALSVAGSLLQEVGQQGMAAKIGVMAVAIAEMVASFAQALKTCKTWYEWLAFGASGMAMLVSMIGTVKQFNGGGLVDSNAMVGDKNLIGVNGGEMILNKGQQANLFRLLDNGGAVGGATVTSVKIKGSDLYLALSNYSKIKSKIGKSTGIR